MKEFTQDEMDTINAEFTAAYEAWLKVWRVSIKGFRIDSKEYRAICRAGSVMNKVYFALDAMPGNDGKIKLSTACAWS